MELCTLKYIHKPHKFVCAHTSPCRGEDFVCAHVGTIVFCPVNYGLFTCPSWSSCVRLVAMPALEAARHFRDMVLLPPPF